MKPGPSRVIDSHGSSPMGAPICMATMPQLASAMASAVPSTASPARAQPPRMPPSRSISAASSAASTAIQLSCPLPMRAARIQAAAMPALPSSSRNGASNGMRCGEEAGIVRPSGRKPDRIPPARRYNGVLAWRRTATI